ncbi:cell wall hydrolase [Billgrantia saliphila]|uniref:cell wall hydrolase n=1 Tax=Billgrantia saliphila TaxID=1848458 RepID=UPI000CE5480A|nr:cell wall hydrolase [Halomonas saliphila]
MRHSRVAGYLLSALLLAPLAFAEPESEEKVIIIKAEVLEQVVAPDKEASALAEPITRQEAQVVDPAGTNPLNDPLTCLARTIYWEAKGTLGLDMESVASVVMNRLAHEDFPNTICEVVKQGSERSPCQFSWWCDGRPDEVVEGNAYEITKEVARRALNRQLPDKTDGALYFHDRSVMPDWAHEFQLTTETDAFFFYRPQASVK